MYAYIYIYICIRISHLLNVRGTKGVPGTGV